MQQDQQQESERRRERAVRLIKEAIATADVKDYSEYFGTPSHAIRYWLNDPKDAPDSVEWPSQRWDRFKIEYESDVILLIQLNTQEGLAWVETSLLGTAVHLIIGAEKILDGPDAAKAFEIDTPQARDDAIEFNVKGALVSYIDYLPVMLSRAVEGAFEDSIQRQVKTSIEPAMRDHWQSVGLPEDFDVLAAWGRASYVENVDEYRKFFVGTKKPVIPESLPQLYQDLRKEYAKAKRHHNESRNLFLRSNKEAAWRKYWEESCLQMFPRLAYQCLMMLCSEGHQQNSITASQLAHKHLSFWFGRSPEYMRKQVSHFVGLAKDKARRTKSKS